MPSAGPRRCHLAGGGRAGEEARQPAAFRVWGPLYHKANALARASADRVGDSFLCSPCCAVLTVVINPVLKMFKQILTLLCGLMGGFVAQMLQTHPRDGNRRGWAAHNTPGL